MNKLDDNLNEDTILDDDDKLEWWKPTAKDNFNLTKKLLRVGCRPVQRRYLECIRNEDYNYKECVKLKEDLTKCSKLAQFVYATVPHHEQQQQRNIVHF